MTTRPLPRPKISFSFISVDIKFGLSQAALIEEIVGFHLLKLLKVPENDPRHIDQNTIIIQMKYQTAIAFWEK